MRADLNMSLKWITTFVLLFLLVSVRVSGASQCEDGTYEHDGRQCCLCAAGWHRVEHCTTNLQYGKCERCEAGTFMSRPNNLDRCEPCTSCSQPNENLEEEAKCDNVRDSKCRCKDNHYCVGDTDVCRLCHLCTECGPEGVKVACSGRNNTVCNEPNTGGSNAGTIVGIIVASVAVIAVIIGVALLLKKRRQGQHTPVQFPNENGADEVLYLKENVDLQPHLSDIAVEIGWDDMKEMANRRKIPKTRIDDCQRNHPANAHEQTLELLGIWVEKEGMQAGNILIQTLLNNNKRLKAQRVKQILSGGS